MLRCGRGCECEGPLVSPAAVCLLQSCGIVFACMLGFTLRARRQALPSWSVPDWARPSEYHLLILRYVLLLAGNYHAVKAGYCIDQGQGRAAVKVKVFVLQQARKIDLENLR